MAETWQERLVEGRLFEQSLEQRVERPIGMRVLVVDGFIVQRLPDDPVEASILIRQTFQA